MRGTGGWGAPRCVGRLFLFSDAGGNKNSLETHTRSEAVHFKMGRGGGEFERGAVGAPLNGEGAVLSFDGIAGKKGQRPRHPRREALWRMVIFSKERGVPF